MSTKKVIYPHSTNYPVEYAFTSGGKDYFRFVDLNNMPARRALNAIVYYIELSTLCDEEYLSAHYAAVKKILSAKNSINLVELVKLNEHLGERLKVKISEYHVFKYASVVFFDANENVNSFDHAYAMTKINHWKKHNDPNNDFFLMEPLRNLIPHLGIAGQWLPNYLEVVNKMLQFHLETLSEILSSDELSNDLIQKLNSQILTLSKPKS